MASDRLPWKDRFTQPSPADLRAGLPAETAKQFDRARTGLRRLEGVSETVGWYGSSWCWSLEYRATPTGDPIALLIPAPEDLQLALRIEPEFVDSLPVRRLKRAVRDGLDLGREPFDTRWAVWSIGEGLLADVEPLVERRLKHLREASGRA